MASLMKIGLLLVAAVFWIQSILSAAEIYMVGDSIGWTILNNPNYTAWASNKTFHAGDTLLFKYNKKFHNVQEVNKADYDACKNESALETFTTGDDAVTVKTAGHHYYICGVPGHCQAAQKVDIRVIAGGGGADAPASSAAPSLLPPGTPTTPASNFSAPASSAGARSMMSHIFGMAATSYLVYLYC